MVKIFNGMLSFIRVDVGHSVVALSSEDTTGCI